ncbi:hypothetical protein M422DRAFT_262014 [Sphaerobolus stellatus SS14]|uniref:Calcineurin-like phosphoesterase domain-containing protein n=1 Tax=Sphaerobolus stellatus (strain SS14) TaxID=990650 RepID=A0A0C9TYT2_SPHS4|nr:hypothetical protein M422DRAFT_262014 [Sphaerobolus stellatus SS14]
MLFHFPNWPLQLPRKFVSQGRKPFQVVHFSDVHIDRQYTLGSEANCTQNICCRNFSDLSGPVKDPPQPFGNSHCDSPSDLADSMLDATREFAPEAKFSIFTGDVIEGATWLVDESEGLQDLGQWNAQMTAKVGYPVYGAIGNHDAAPMNSFPRNNTESTIGSQWVFNTQNSGWERWIGVTAADQLRHASGSYAVVVPDISLRADPNGILAFMVGQLQAAEDAGELVCAIYRGAITNISLLKSNYYDQIVQRYRNTIAAQFFGHSHKDQFEIAYSDFSKQTAETADSIIFIAPALTPTSGNAAFKVYDIDPETFEVMDAKVYMNPSFHVKPQWQLYYSARESYGPFVGGLQATDSLNPAFWHNLTEVFETNDTAFQLFNTRISRGGAVDSCTDDCKTTTICDMRAARSQNNCDIQRRVFN